MKSEVVVIHGPMFAGKTTHLLKLYDFYSQNESTRCILVKPSIDTRYDPVSVSTHTGTKRPATVVDDLKSLVMLDQVTHVFIDEAQFFSNLDCFLDYCQSIGSIQGVFFAGLMFDCKQHYFGDLHSIATRSREIILESTCSKCRSQHGIHTVQSQEFGQDTRRISATGYLVLCNECLVVHNQTH